VASLKELVRRNATILRQTVRVYGFYESLRDRHLDGQARWERRTRDEVDWWRAALARGECRDLLDGEAEVQPSPLRRALGEIAGSDVSILDVGAGPLTAAGHRWPGKILRITATDPLAARYRTILEDLHITPPLWTVALAGEHLQDAYGLAAFDISYAQNALDHSNDPWGILRQMFAVSRSFVALKHFRNEGEHNGYVGMHAWNIDIDTRGVVFWNREQHVDVTAAAEQLGWTSEQWIETNEHGIHVLVLFRRR
jgi:hypothetical protein